MTIDAAELSAYGAAPVELFRFVRGPKIWTLTSADAAHSYSGDDYAPAPIARSGQEDTANLSKRELTLTLPGDHEIPGLYAGYPPGEVVGLIIYRRHWSDVDLETVPIWSGRVINCYWSGAVAHLVCEPIDTSLKRQGLTRPYSKNCPYDLFGLGCGLSADSFRFPATLSAVDGVSLTAPFAAGFPDGYFSGGMATWLSPQGYTDARMILDHTGQAITLLAPMRDLAAGIQVVLHPGCDHTTTTCKVKFNNLLNFGGWPFMPEKNPFNGTLIY